MSSWFDKMLFGTVFFVLGDYVGIAGAISFARKILDYLQEIS